MIEKYRKYYSHLGEAVRQVRTADTDFTQTQLAKRLGVKQSYISKIESGKIRLGIIEVREICMELNITLVEFAKKLESIIANDHSLKWKNILVLHNFILKNPDILLEYQDLFYIFAVGSGRNPD